jgi:chromate transporter
VPRLRRSRVAGAVLDGVNVASLALMVVVSWRLGRAAIVDWWTLVVAVASLVAIVRYRLNPAWLIAAGAALGWMSLSLA